MQPTPSVGFVCVVVHKVEDPTSRDLHRNGVQCMGVTIDALRCFRIGLRLNDCETDCDVERQGTRTMISPAEAGASAVAVGATVPRMDRA